MDTFDLNRVEVLRGPQGALFGSASMGGSVNYVVNTADPESFDAAVQATVSQTRNADLGGALKGMINIPLKQDVLAIRAVGTYRNAPGFLDNIGSDVEGSNELVMDGGRLSMVLAPNEDTRISWLSLLQNLDSDDNAYRMPAVGDLKRDTQLNEFTDTRVAVHSLQWDQSMGWADFSALAALMKKEQDWRFDFTPLRDAYNTDLGLNLTAPLYVNSGGESDSHYVELRLASPGGGRLDWQIGAMAYETDKTLYEALAASGAADAFNNSPNYPDGAGNVIAPDGKIFNSFHTDITGKEQALFGQLSWQLGAKWNLSIGGRLFQTEVETTSTQVGFSTYPGQPTVSYAATDDSGFTPKLSISYDVNDNLMFYGLVSEGFRFGQPNVSGLSDYPMPTGSHSDSLVNYELGMRSRLLQDRLRFNLTAFYVDWDDIQLRLQTPDFFNYATNGGAAHSQGVEMALNWLIGDRFSWRSSVTWQQARLDDPMDILYVGTAPAGSRLPGSSDWSVNNTFSYRFPGTFAPTLSLTQQYISDGISDLSSAVDGAVLHEQGDYNLFDVRYRMSFGYRTDVTLFVSNLTDERGVTRSVSEINGLAQGIVRPRTFGVTVDWHY